MTLTAHAETEARRDNKALERPLNSGTTEYNNVVACKASEEARDDVESIMDLRNGRGCDGMARDGVGRGGVKVGWHWTG